MGRDWEQTFRRFSKPSSEAEKEKCDRVERMIRQAIRESPKLAKRNVQVFSQGSYRNLTNARLESDVDICVLCTNPFFYDCKSAQGFTKEDVGLIPGSYPYSRFKNEVCEALVAMFGQNGVTRGNKAFDVHENSCRVDADVVACFEHRRYTFRTQDGGFLYQSGTHFVSDDGKHVLNWPEQNHENGIAKNKATNGRFKFITRVLKQIRYEMKDKRMAVVEPIPSYLVECLVYNAANACFGNSSYEADVRSVLECIRDGTATDANCQEWVEVNEIKYLFRSAQPWTRQQAHDFLTAVWSYLGFQESRSLKGQWSWW